MTTFKSGDKMVLHAEVVVANYRGDSVYIRYADGSFGWAPSDTLTPSPAPKAEREAVPSVVATLRDSVDAMARLAERGPAPAPSPAPEAKREWKKDDLVINAIDKSLGMAWLVLRDTHDGRTWQVRYPSGELGIWTTENLRPAPEVKAMTDGERMRNAARVAEQLPPGAYSELASFEKALWESAAQAVLAAQPKGEAAETVPMILTCPSCRERHIDEGDFATKVHHTHACQGCGTVWRPAIVATVGVQFLPGYKSAAAQPVAKVEREVAYWAVRSGFVKGHGRYACRQSDGPVWTEGLGVGGVCSIRAEAEDLAAKMGGQRRIVRVTRKVRP